MILQSKIILEFRNYESAKQIHIKITEHDLNMKNKHRLNLWLSSFAFSLFEFINMVSAGYSPSETSVSLESYETQSPLLSVEFLVLLLIFLSAVFAYRWFRKGRLDFYEMWEEIRGKK